MQPQTNHQLLHGIFLPYLLVCVISHSTPGARATFNPTGDRRSYTVIVPRSASADVLFGLEVTIREVSLLDSSLPPSCGPSRLRICGPSRLRICGLSPHLRPVALFAASRLICGPSRLLALPAGWQGGHAELSRALRGRVAPTEPRVPQAPPGRARPPVVHRQRPRPSAGARVTRLRHRLGRVQPETPIRSDLPATRLVSFY